MDNVSTTVASCSDTPHSKLLPQTSTPASFPSSGLTWTVHTAKDSSGHSFGVKRATRWAHQLLGLASSLHLWASRIPPSSSWSGILPPAPHHMQLYPVPECIYVSDVCMFDLIRISKQQANSAHIINWAILKSVRCLLFQSQLPTQVMRYHIQNESAISHKLYF